MRHQGTLLASLAAAGMLTGSATAQGQWAFGDPTTSDRGERIHATVAGDFLLTGSQVLTRFDAGGGSVQWRVGLDGYHPQDVLEASDGRVVSVGLHVDDVGNQSLALVFHGPGGNFLDWRLFPGRAIHEHHDLIETAVGDFVIAAETTGDSGTIVPMLIRTDSDGNLRWCHRYEMPEHPFGQADFCDVEETRLDDGRSVFHLTGRFQSESFDKMDTLMATIDDDGFSIDSAYMGYPDYTDFGRGLAVLPDGYLVTGFSKELGEGGGTYLMRLAPDFSLQWYRGLQQFSGTRSIELDADGTITLAGTSSFPDPVRGAAIVQMSLAAPNSASGMRYGGMIEENAYELVRDGAGFALAGDSRSFGTSQADAYLVRTDAGLLSGCEEAPYQVAVDAHQIPVRELKLVAEPLEPHELKASPFGTEWFEVVICEDEPMGPCTDPPIEMTGWWTMDELVGLVAADSISGMDGTHAGSPQIIAGMVENALDFDGVGDHLEIVGNPLLGLDGAAMTTGDVTVDAWIRVDSAGPMDWGPIFAVDGGHSCRGWSFYVRNDRLEAAFTDGPLQARWTSSTPIPHGQWVHVAFALDRGLPVETCRFYVDGVEEAGTNAFPFTPTIGAIPAAAGFIGRMPGNCADGAGTPRYFDGAIDEVEHFRRALDAAEIQAIHAAGEAGKCKVSCDPPWDIPFCVDDAFVDVTIPVCNASQVDADVQLGFNGLSPVECGSIPGPTGFTVLGANPVVVPAGQCVNVVVRIDRPMGMNAVNQVGCYEVVLENLVDGRISSCWGSVQDRRDLCPMSPWEPVEIEVGVLADVVLPFVDTGFDGDVIEWRAVAYGPDMRFSPAIALNGNVPGVSVTGMVETTPGQKGAITLDLLATRFVAGYSDLVFFTRSGDDTWVPLASMALRMEPGVLDCPADFNGDFRVDGGDLGLMLGDWGLCEGCVTDLDGNGFVNGGDLGLLLAFWGQCGGR